ncbi:MAG: hypothetical protein VKI42_06390 [Synechococcaceae cyanobacterium]|nr:hypothetical protein [Synechococcaceae cyanobacterium]
MKYLLETMTNGARLSQFLFCIYALIGFILLFGQDAATFARDPEGAIAAFFNASLLINYLKASFPVCIFFAYSYLVRGVEEGDWATAIIRPLGIAVVVIATPALLFNYFLAMAAPVGLLIFALEVLARGSVWGALAIFAVVLLVLNVILFARSRKK